MSQKGWEGFGTAVANVLGERLASPLVSTFAISWSLWNFKFFVILFSNNSVTGTYMLVQTQCFPNWYMSLFNGLIAPLVLTMAYFYLLPILSKIIFEEWSRTQKETKDIRQRWEDQELLGSEKALELRHKLRETERQIEDADIELRKLKAEARLTDQKLVEQQDAHRVASTNHKSVGEELSRTNAVVDALRNETATLRDQLTAARDAADHHEAELRKLRDDAANTESQKAFEAMNKLQPKAADLLKAIAEGPPAVNRFFKILSPSDKAQARNDAVLLRSKGFIAGKKPVEEDEITRKGLAYLLVNTHIDADEFLRYFSRTRDNTGDNEAAGVKL